MIKTNKGANPDILSCLANLSSDEVFTSPELVNKMLDMLPQDLFKNPDTKFLDPACKSGVFLREITKRLIDGLEEVIPDLQERIDHILHDQVYGIAITELTSYISRRSLYCSKYPNGDFSISKFDTSEGNIVYRRIEHTWQGDKCAFCGANKKQYKRSDDLESHAYNFIHLNIEKLFNMKFDVIISNPPYQLSDGGAQASAMPIYQLFVRAAKKLKPKYVVMIVPSRWMTGGKGLDDFRDEMIHDKHITKLVDYANSDDCFTGVEIEGGICYFLWDYNTEGMCEICRVDSNGTSCSTRYLAEEGDDIHVKYHQLLSIRNKIQCLDVNSYEKIVSSRKPYGLATDFFQNPKKYGLPELFSVSNGDDLCILGLEGTKRTKRYVPKDYPLPSKGSLDKFKLFISKTYGCTAIGEKGPTPVLPLPVIAKPGELCTETFIEIGSWDTLDEAENAVSYYKTKFFRCLVGIRKQTQQISKNIFRYVPMQDFSKTWTDAELYKKYNLSEEEIEFVESMITPME